MNCKAELRGGKYDTYDTYECRICNQDLPLERFHSERLEAWKKNKHHNLITCLKCTAVPKGNGGIRKPTNIGIVAAAVRRHFHALHTTLMASLIRMPSSAWSAIEQR